MLLAMNSATMDEDWGLLVSLFPPDWRTLAVETNAVKGLRRDKDEELLLRTLLLHVGCGYSLRETAVRASQAGWAELSDVAVLKRLRKCEGWLHGLCQSLLARRGIDAPRAGAGQLRLIDATEVKEPGKTGSLWRIHYSLSVPQLQCDHFELTPVEGTGTGESLKRYDVRAGDHLLADRGYSSAQGLHHVVSNGAHATVRLCPQRVRLHTPAGGDFNLEQSLRSLQKTNQEGSWAALISDAKGAHRVAGRICALRKSEAAIQIAKRKIERRAARRGNTIMEQTWLYAEYVMVFTTVPEDRLSTREILDLYRYRWQVELVFKRLKQLASLGHLPKHDPSSSRAWLYGKLFVALMTEQLIAQAASFSPWGY